MVTDKLRNEIMKNPINLDDMTDDELTVFIMKTPKGNLRSYAISMQRARAAIENGCIEEARYFFGRCDGIYDTLDPKLHWR